MNSHVSSGLCVITLGQCRFTDCSKCTTLVWGFERGGGCVDVGVWGVWEISVPFAQFYCEPKTTLKNKVCFLKGEKRNLIPISITPSLPIAPVLSLWELLLCSLLLRTILFLTILDNS